ncbi:hypothetical protein HPP92_018101 [Vanilla planifolia]|nr:hypothetical protein HPP92_018101 [Vanilla planifolia]
MVPFLWETAPGVPKDTVRRLSFRKEEDFIPPKPPPGRRRPPREADHASARKLHLCSSTDDGNDGDVDSCSDDDSGADDGASDVFDKVSLPSCSAVGCRDPSTEQYP